MALPSIAEMAAKLTGGTASDPNIPAQGEAPAPEVAVETPAADPPPETTAEPVKEAPKDNSASRFAAIARREKAAKQREADVDRRVKEAEARLAAVSEKESAILSFKKDPAKAMRDLGLTYADITQAMVGGYKAPEEDPMDVKLNPVNDKLGKFESEVEKLHRELADLRNQSAAREQREQYDTVMRGIKAVTADVDKYEYINAMGDEAETLVKDTMVEYWNRNQKMLDYSEACDIVEQYYEEHVNRFAKTKKLTKRLPGTQAAPKAAPKPPAKEAKAPSTLTNKLSSAPEANVDINKLPKHEALAYLAKKLQFDL